MSYEITKEQISEVIRTGTATTERYFREILPQAFFIQVKRGKWYLPQCEKGSLWYIKTINRDGTGVGHGFFEGRYRISDSIAIDDNTLEWREATFDEVAQAFYSLAKEQGYKKGVTCAFGSEGQFKRALETDDFVWDGSKLCVKSLLRPEVSDIIFYDGNWVPIVHTPDEVVKTITMDKAVKILSKKYGKQVTIKQK